MSLLVPSWGLSRVPALRMQPPVRLLGAILPTYAPDRTRRLATAAKKRSHKGEGATEAPAERAPPPAADKLIPHELGPYTYTIPKGRLPGMRVPVKLYASPELLRLVVDEVENRQPGGFLPAVEQLANVSSLPGIVGASTGMPDLHSGYAFAIGHVAAFDMDSPEAVVSPGGVGFDINCGVRLLRTDLSLADLTEKRRERLADVLFDLIPVGVGEGSAVKLARSDLDALLKDGMKWTEKQGLSWKEDRQVCEENGCFAAADPSKVSEQAKKRGLKELGSLGSGNHYTEVQVVEEIYDPQAASVMGIDRVGQVCVMIHTGSRGLGHQVASDALEACRRHMERTGTHPVDSQLAYVPIASPEGQSYLKAMAAAANFAFCNRTAVMGCVRQAFEKVFGRSARELGMHMVYDVAHNVAKEEEHTLPDGRRVRVLVHRKGATRAFPPHHPEIPKKYREIGQPVLIGGSMGTASYVLTGTEEAMRQSFGSTSHGAGRALSRSKALKQIDSQEVLRSLQAKGISVRVGSKNLAAEEAPQSYKDVDEVVETCEAVGISHKVVKLRPIAVVKG